MLPQDYVLRFITLDVPPNIIPIVVKNKTVQVDGFLAMSFRYLRQALKMPYEIKNFGDVEAGMEIEPGNFTGVVGRMYRGEADVLTGQLPIMEEHFPYIGFSTSFDISDYSLVSGPPITVFQSKANFLNSLGLDFWIVMSMTWFLLSVGYFFVVKTEGKIIKPNPYKEGMIECMLTFYGLLFQRGFENLPENVSSRLMVVGWLLLVIIVMTDLAGTITSQMAVADVPLRFERTEQVLDFPELRFYTTRGLYADVYMSQSDDPKIKEVWKQVNRFDGLRNYTEFFDSPWIMDMISRGEAVAIENVDCTLLYWINEDCKRMSRPYHIAKKPLLSRPWAFLYRRGLPPEIIEFLSRTATNFGSSGLHQLIKVHAGKDAIPCLNYAFDQSFKPMVVRDLFDTMVILLLGLGVATAVLILEILCGTGGKYFKATSLVGKILTLIGYHLFDV